jgi:hypothetical protein
LKADSSTVNQVFKDNTLNFSNEFNVIKALKSNNIIQAYSYVSHSAEPENRVIGPGYNASIFNNNVPYAQLVQNVNVPSWYTNNYFSFKIPSETSSRKVSERVLAFNRKRLRQISTWYKITTAPTWNRTAR